MAGEDDEMGVKAGIAFPARIELWQREGVVSASACEARIELRGFLVVRSVVSFATGLSGSS